MTLGDRSRWCKSCGEILVYYYRTHDVEICNPDTGRMEVKIRLNGKFYCLACARIRGFWPTVKEEKEE